MATSRMGYASPVSGLSYGEWRRQGILKNQLKKRTDDAGINMALEERKQQGQTRRSKIAADTNRYIAGTRGQGLRDIANIQATAMAPLRAAQEREANIGVDIAKYGFGQAKKEDIVLEQRTKAASDTALKEKKKASILSKRVPTPPDPTIGRYLWGSLKNDAKNTMDYFDRVFSLDTYMQP